MIVRQLRWRIVHGMYVYERRLNDTGLQLIQYQCIAPDRNQMRCIVGIDFFGSEAFRSAEQRRTASSIDQLERSSGRKKETMDAPESQGSFSDADRGIRISVKSARRTPSRSSGCISSPSSVASCMRARAQDTWMAPWMHRWDSFGMEQCTCGVRSSKGHGRLHGSPQNVQRRGLPPENKTAFRSLIFSVHWTSW